MPRLESQAKGQYYPTPTEVVKMLSVRLEADRLKNGHTIRFLDPCAGTGAALQQLVKSSMSKAGCQTYGVELNGGRAEEAAENLDNILAADIFQTAIGNEAFSCLFLNPPYDFNVGGGRAEYTFLERTSRYLAPHGILIYIVPMAQLSGAARYLSEHYSDLECYSFPDEDFEKFKQVVVLGTKKRTRSPSHTAAAKIQGWSETRPEALGYRQSKRLKLPQVANEGIRFITTSLEPWAATQEARLRGSWAKPEVEYMLTEPPQTRRRPLMPLRKGHIAGLLAAGLLNNLTLGEGDDRVLVKGQVTKKRQLSHVTETEEVHRDRLITTVTYLNLNTGVMRKVAT